MMAFPEVPRDQRPHALAVRFTAAQMDFIRSMPGKDLATNVRACVQLVMCHVQMKYHTIDNINVLGAAQFADRKPSSSFKKREEK